MRNAHDGQASSSMRVECAVHGPITPGEKVVAAVTTTSIQAIPPENRGSPMLMAHGSVDTTNTAAHVPVANRLCASPPVATSSTVASASQLANPGAMDAAQ